jgi:putative hydrolase of HD superfamily
MSKPSFAALLKIQQELILPFYAIERATPLPKQFNRHENDAEHSWGLALLACALAPEVDPSLNVGLICQFAVVHDLVEVFAGDTPNFASDDVKAGKEARELQGLEQMKVAFAGMPWIIDMVTNYEAQDTPEAHFVRSLDKTLSLMQEHASDGQIFQDYQITKAELLRVLEPHRKKAMIHDQAFDYYRAAEKLLLDNPHFFHEDAKEIDRL